MPTEVPASDLPDNPVAAKLGAPVPAEDLPAPAPSAESGGIGASLANLDPTNPANIGRFSKFLIRDVPPVAMQGAGAVGGSALGLASPVPGGAVAGEMAGGAAGSVAGDFYTRFIDRMFGDAVQPMTLKGEAVSAGLGAVGPLLPSGTAKAAGILTGESAARAVATDAFKTATEEGSDLLAKQAKITDSIATKQAEEDAKAAVERTNLLDKQAAAKAGIAESRQSTGKAALADIDETRASLEDQVAKDRAKLGAVIQKSLEEQRAETAAQVGNQQIQGMIEKTPGQLAKQEALPYEKYAPMRAKVQSSYFDNELAFHNEIGQKFEKYIGPVKNEPLHPDMQTALHSDLDAIATTVDQRGQRLVSSELKKVFDEIAPEAAPGADNKLLQALHEQNPGVNPLGKKGKPVFGEDADPSTIGKLWGQRGRLGQIARSSTNPADRWAALQGIDAITKHLPNIPENVRQEYSFSKALYDRTTSHAIATARTPGEVGAAIYGSPTSPEPAQVALNLIRKAKTPDELQGLRDAFADNWLAKGRDPDQFGQYLQTHGDVVKGLYGNRAAPIVRMFGHEGSVKSASWAKLMQVSPEARTAFEGALKESYRSQQAVAIQQTIAKGQQALDQLPSRYGAVRAALRAAKTPEAKLEILQRELPEPKQIQPSESQSETLAQTPPDPRQAAVDSLTGKKPIPQAQFERYATRFLVMRAMLGGAFGYGMLYQHPMVGVVGGTMLGGRELLRMALKNPQIADSYVRMLDIGATPKNASALGKLMGPLMGATVVQTIKDDHESSALTPAP